MLNLWWMISKKILLIIWNNNICSNNSNRIWICINKICSLEGKWINIYRILAIIISNLIITIVTVWDSITMDSIIITIIIMLMDLIQIAMDFDIIIDLINK